jgi:hypothetical protein
VSAIGCADPSDCFVGNSDGFMWSSANPSGGTSAWTEFRPGNLGPAFASVIGNPRGLRGFAVSIRFRATGLPGANVTAFGKLYADIRGSRHFTPAGSATFALTAPHVASLTVRLSKRGRTLLQTNRGVTFVLFVGSNHHSSGPGYTVVWTRAGGATITIR